MVYFQASASIFLGSTVAPFQTSVSSKMVYFQNSEYMCLFRAKTSIPGRNAEGQKDTDFEG